MEVAEHKKVLPTDIEEEDYYTESELLSKFKE